MAYGLPNVGAPQQMATPKRPVQLAPNMGTTPRPRGAQPSTRRAQMRPGRQPGGVRRRQPQSRGPGGPGGGGPPMGGGPSQPIADPMNFPPLEDEFADLGAAVGMARIPGIGQPGAERGVLNVRRRRAR
jgi:hypothetical protein